MSKLIELDQEYIDTLRSYDEALAAGDRSAVEFYSRRLSQLDVEISKEGAEVEYYDLQDSLT